MTAVAEIEIEGEVLDRPTFVNLYRLLDLEAATEEEAQRLTMPAAFDVLRAYESNEWRDDKQAERDAFIAANGYQPPWSATSTESFVRWLQVRAERDGHPFRSRGDLIRLKDAGTMHTLVIERMKSNGVSPRGEGLPRTEKAWRPLRKLYTHGFIDELVDAVSRAAELATAEGKEITPGITSKTRTEVWRTAPRIRTWVEQPGQVDARSQHDRAVTAYNNAKAAADELRKLDDGQMWRRFVDYIQGVDA